MGLPEAGNVVSNQGADYMVRLLSEIRYAIFTCDLYTLLQICHSSISYINMYL